MLNQTMYPGINNSPQTTTAAEITAAAQEIPLLSAAGFPAGPNLATLGTDEGAEVIRYNGISGNSLTGCERGFYGTTAKIWPVDTLVYRAFSLYDYEALRSNVTQLDTDKLDADGDGSDLTAAFTPAESREAIATGETAATLWGKVSKWLSDLKAVAFSGQYADLTGAPTTMTPTAHAATHGTGGADAITPSSIGAQPSVTASGLLKGDGAGGITAAAAGTDYQAPLTANVDYQTPLTAGTDYATPTQLADKQAKITATGLLKGDGDGGITAAAAGTDYQAPLTAGTDYAPPSQSITATLLSTGWSDGSYTLSIVGITADTNGYIGLSQTASAQQRSAWGAALPYISQQTSGTIIISLDSQGTVPTIDIPLEVTIL